MLYDRRQDLDEIGRIMYRIADFIEQHNWNQQVLFFSPDKSYCAMGAANMILHGHSRYVHFEDLQLEEIQKRLIIKLNLKEGFRSNTSKVCWWNNHAKSKEEVVEGFREAAYVKETENVV